MNEALVISPYFSLVAANDSNPSTMEEKKSTHEATVLAASSDIALGDVELQGFDVSATKKLLRKLDRHIIPFMSLIYL